MYKTIIKYTLIISFFFISCKKDEISAPCENQEVSNSINKIMPLGASRVEGATPEYESYRYDLWKKLIDGGWNFDFIGSTCDQGEYATYGGTTFDPNHEGHGGWTSGDLKEEINGWLAKTGAPDFVLFSSPGGNDALNGQPFDEALENVNDIIDAIQAVNPNVTILIEQLAPAHSSAMTTELTTFFSQMNEAVLTLASEQTTATSTVIAIDMATGFSDDYLADDVHYNSQGSLFIAEKYYAVLAEHLE